MLRLIPIVMSTLAFSFGGTTARAQTGGEARDLALTALRLEFERDNVTETDEALEGQFRLACERGYNPACRRSTWFVDQQVDMIQVHDVFLSSCEAGDQVACLVVSWSLDAQATSATTNEERDRIWRRAARILKNDCDAGFAAACHDYAGFLYEDKGVVISDARPALKEWNRACDMREWAACTELARLYNGGAEGVKNNQRASRTYAKKACDNGYPDGCYELGRMDDHGWGASGLDSYYGGLCEDGHKEACWRLARTYYDGIHPEPVEGRTQVLFERACELDHPRACYEAGQWELDHDGIEAKAATFFGQACRLQDSAGCSAQVDMILSGQVEGTVKSAYRAFEIACDQRQSIEACTQVAYHVLDQESPQFDAVRGRELLKRVCTAEGSDPQVCFILGRSLEEGIGGDRDRTEASTFYRWSCAAGNVEACMRRGELLSSDVGVRRDDHEALVMFGRACDGGLPESCHPAGVILEEGTYVRQDLAMAASWFAKGCDGGHHPACSGLGRVYEIGTDGSPDMETAREAYQKALDLGSLESKRSLARLLWNGYGGRKSRRKAKGLCREACQSGDAVACRGPAFL